MSSSSSCHFHSRVVVATCFVARLGLLLCTATQLSELEILLAGYDVMSVDDHGAVGDGHTEDTKVKYYKHEVHIRTQNATAFLSAWETACNTRGAPLLLIPRGKSFLVGPTNFNGPCLSSVRVQIAGNMVAPDSILAWDGNDGSSWLSFTNVKGLVIDGSGEINGQGPTWWVRSCKINREHACSSSAPAALTISKCTDLVITNLNLVNSQQVHLNIWDSLDVFISGVNITAPGNSPNTDGIHLHNSQRVNIENCFISTGDDCISIVTDSSDVNITRIYCGPGHGISIGSLGKGGKLATVERIAVKNATFNGTTNGARIKTWQGGHGYARNIQFEQLVFINVSNPIIIDQYYCDSTHKCKNQTSAVAISNVRYIGASGTSFSKVAIKLACSEAVGCDNIFLEDVNISTTVQGKPTLSYSLNVQGATSGTILPPLPGLPSITIVRSTPPLPPPPPAVSPAMPLSPAISPAMPAPQPAVSPATPAASHTTLLTPAATPTVQPQQPVLSPAMPASPAVFPSMVAPSPVTPTPPPASQPVQPQPPLISPAVLLPHPATRIPGAASPSVQLEPPL